jgi:hypothetical protein
MAYDIIVTITGKEHTGKTSLLGLIAELLQQHGVAVSVAHLDPTLDDKITNIDDSLERVRRSKILLTEFQTFPSENIDYGPDDSV